MQTQNSSARAVSAVSRLVINQMVASLSKSPLTDDATDDTARAVLVGAGFGSRTIATLSRDAIRNWRSVMNTGGAA
ncbi:hypothetical protein [Marivivens aquimaris]|uniref:hypothetical protein n=1 Tax=Marivivens aquimaris TaxID=2774876 RepID=UPI0018812FFB|nr:hypothetical protein [Marivivens aquimaris]